MQGPKWPCVCADFRDCRTHLAQVMVFFTPPVRVVVMVGNPRRQIMQGGFDMSVQPGEIVVLVVVVDATVVWAP